MGGVWGGEFKEGMLAKLLYLSLYTVYKTVLQFCMAIATFEATKAAASAVFMTLASVYSLSFKKKSSAVTEMGDRLATTDVPKSGG